MWQRQQRGRLNTTRTWQHTIRSRYISAISSVRINLFCLYCFLLKFFFNYTYQSEKPNDDEEEEDGSDKSKSEINDDDEDDDESGEVFICSELINENSNRSVSGCVSMGVYLFLSWRMLIV